MQKSLSDALGAVVGACNHLSGNPKDDPLFVFKVRSFDYGEKYVQAFVSELNKAVLAAIADTPQTKSTRKTRQAPKARRRKRNE